MTLIVHGYFNRLFIYCRLNEKAIRKRKFYYRHVIRFGERDKVNNISTCPISTLQNIFRNAISKGLNIINLVHVY